VQAQAEVTICEEFLTDVVMHTAYVSSSYCSVTFSVQFNRQEHTERELKERIRKAEEGRKKKEERKYTKKMRKKLRKESFHNFQTCLTILNFQIPGGNNVCYFRD